MSKSGQEANDAFWFYYFLPTEDKEKVKENEVLLTILWIAYLVTQERNAEDILTSIFVLDIFILFMSF